MSAILIAKKQKLYEITLDYVKSINQNKQDKPKPSLLGKLFVMLSKPNESGFSELIKFDNDCFNIFKTSNGGNWNRSNQSWIGKIYNLRREKEKGQVVGMKLDGKNKGKTIIQYIDPSIKKTIQKKRCTIIDVSSNIECDHKDGTKDDWKLVDPKTQEANDFQPLSKAANDAKRSHCKVCKETHKR